MSSRDRHHQDADSRFFSRSRSPEKVHGQSHRTRSPHHYRHRRHRRSKHFPEKEPCNELPYGARQLVKKDYAMLKPMFAQYLDIQKQKSLGDMDQVETKGRWKSFIGKWNRGELAEGWYEPSTLQKAIVSSVEQDYDQSPRSKQTARLTGAVAGLVTSGDHSHDSDSDSCGSIGPTLPGQGNQSGGRQVGPRVPNMQDLELKRDIEAEDRLASWDKIRLARKLDRKQQKEALDELIPRADAGTRERQFEKKKELNEKMKSFRDKSPGAAEMPDSELMGGGDTLSDFKRQKQDFERKKNERELRKMEMLRARAVEREERWAEYKRKEDKTIAMLQAIAKQNFG